MKIKSTDQDPKITLLNVSEKNMGLNFQDLVRLLKRTGHEIVATEDTKKFIEDKLGFKVTCFFEKLNQEGRAIFSKISVAVFDIDASFPYNVDGVRLTSSALVNILLLSNSHLTILTDLNDYSLFIAKTTNIHGVRPKDKRWFALKAAQVFKLGDSTVASLIEGVRPRMPSNTIGMQSHILSENS